MKIVKFYGPTMLLSAFYSLSIFANQERLHYSEGNKHTYSNYIFDDFILELDSRIEWDISISYRLECYGRRPPLHVKLFSGSIALLESMGNNQILNFSTRGSFSIEPEDMDLLLKFQSLYPCSFILNEPVSYSPSIDTIENWRNEAEGLKNELGLTLDLFRLSHNFDEMLSWNSSRIEATISQLEREISAELPQSDFKDLLYPTDYPDADLRGQLKDESDMPEDYIDILDSTDGRYLRLEPKIRILIQLKSIKGGAPRRSDVSSTDKLKDLIQDKINKSNSFLERGRTWHAKINDQFRASLKSLESITDQFKKEFEE